MRKKKTNKELLPGSEIEISKQDYQELDNIVESIKTAEEAFKYAAFLLRASKKSLWHCLNERYPETKIYHCQYLYENHKLIIGRKIHYHPKRKPRSPRWLSHHL